MLFNKEEYTDQVKDYNVNTLTFVIKDCATAIEAMPNNPKVLQYIEEMRICHIELIKREKAIAWEKETTFSKIYNRG